jgi:hypothetical protein
MPVDVSGSWLGHDRSSPLVGPILPPYPSSQNPRQYVLVYGRSGWSPVVLRFAVPAARSRAAATMFPPADIGAYLSYPASTGTQWLFLYEFVHKLWTNLLCGCRISGWTGNTRRTWKKRRVSTESAGRLRWGLERAIDPRACSGSTEGRFLWISHRIRRASPSGAVWTAEAASGGRTGSGRSGRVIRHLSNSFF